MEHLYKTENVKIGFIGFGEAVTSIIEGLKESTNIDIAVWYHRIHDGTPKCREVREQAKNMNVSICENLEQLSKNTHLIINLTTSEALLNTAEEILPYIQSETIYADLNSAGPNLKREVNEKMKEISVSFVDGAVMAPVPMSKHRVPILVSGEGAEKFKSVLEPLGMRIDVIDGGAGSASAVKMARSIFMKGLAALTIETYSIAQLQGEEVFNKVFDSIDDTFATPYHRLAERFVLGTMKHAERRVGEVDQAIQLFAEKDLRPIMSESTRKALLEIAKHKPGFEPTSMKDPRIIEYLQGLFNNKSTEQQNNQTVVAKDE